MASIEAISLYTCRSVTRVYLSLSSHNLAPMASIETISWSLYTFRSVTRDWLHVGLKLGFQTKTSLWLVFILSIEARFSSGSLASGPRAIQPRVYLSLSPHNLAPMASIEAISLYTCCSVTRVYLSLSPHNLAPMASIEAISLYTCRSVTRVYLSLGPCVQQMLKWLMSRSNLTGLVLSALNLQRCEHIVKSQKWGFSTGGRPMNIFCKINESVLFFVKQFF